MALDVRAAHGVGRAATCQFGGTARSRRHGEEEDEIFKTVHSVGLSSYAVALR